MRPRCIVSDLDRTLTGADLKLGRAPVERIDALRAAGIRFVVATGRRLDELEAMGLPSHVDALVAENGAILFVPGEGKETRHTDFASSAKRALGKLADAFHWGEVLGSGPRGLAPEVSRVLAAAGVAHHLEYNAEEVMLLPPGVDKGAGVARCLARLGIAPEEAWAIGDGENDASMLRLVGVGAAPANAAPAAAQAADVRLSKAYEAGFLELTLPLLAPVEPRASAPP